MGYRVAGVTCAQSGVVICNHVTSVTYVTPRHIRYWNRNVDSKARVASMNAALSKSGTRNSRSLALVVSTSTTAPARASSLPTKQSSPNPMAAALKSVAMPSGKKMFTSSAIRTSCLTEAAHSISAKYRSEEHTSELQSLRHLVCRLLLEKKT